MAARANQNANSCCLRLAGAFALAAMTAACAGGMDPGYAVATQDRYDFMECPQILGERGGLIAREKQLTELAAKAEAAPGGVIVSAVAYRSELTQARTQLRLVQRAAQQKGCDSKKP